MKEVITIGLDLAKNVFQVHGVDASGKTVVRRQLRRGQVLGFFGKLPPCLVGLEACASAHYWAREIAALGHEVRMMPARYVKPYVKRNKNDAADAEAICEAVTRPSMRFVAIKTPEQQAVLMVHRTRQLLVRQRTMLVKALRAHLAEFGDAFEKDYLHGSSSLFHGIGKQREETGAFDGAGEFTLLLGRNGGDPGGDDLAPLGDVAL